MIAKVVLTVLAIGFAVVPTGMPAWAGGPGDLPPSCQVANPPGGATALRGTISVAAQSANAGDTNVDFVLRLERGGTLQFFRASVFMTVFATSNENILCTLLKDNTSLAASTLRAAIKQSFGFPQTAGFFIIDKSVTKDETQGEVNQWLCNETFTPPFPVIAPTCGAPRAGSMADVLIYVK
jgi:hypothetical protein